MTFIRVKTITDNDVLINLDAIDSVFHEKLSFGILMRSGIVYMVREPLWNSIVAVLEKIK